MSKSILLLTIAILLLFLSSLSVISVYAQTNQLSNSSDNHTVREEQEGKEIWEKLQAKQISCEELSDDNFQALGEYYMGQMTGTSHAAMNTMMIQMMGEEGEKQMHVVMGKRLSGCNTSVQFPSQGTGFMPMMWMMGGGGNPMTGYGSWGSFGALLFQLTAVVWLIVGVLAALWLFKQINKK